VVNPCRRQETGISPVQDLIVGYTLYGAANAALSFTRWHAGVLAGSGRQTAGRYEPQVHQEGKGAITMKRLLLAAFLGLLLTAGIVTAQAEPANPDAAANVMATLRSKPEFSSFVRLLEKTNLVADLDDGSSYTVFAPTNDALADRMDSLDALDDSSIELTRFVRSYIADGQLKAEDLLDRTTINTLEDTDLDVTVEDRAEGAVAGAVHENKDLSVDGIALANAPLVATNGIIYPIDKLFPASLEGL
jgi:uncharacterized surface protein with fasciclin (FAS1) repeats